VNELWIASYILLWLIVAGMAFIMLGLLRQLGLIQARLGLEAGALITPEGMERGTKAPDFEGLELTTKKHIRFTELQGRRVLLIFLSPICVPCRALAPHLNEVSSRFRSQIETLAICQGSEDACIEFVKLSKLQTKLIADPANFIGASYNVKFTPFAYLIDENGLVLIRGVVNTSAQLEALLQEEGTLQGDKLWQLDVALEATDSQPEVGSLVPK
jgi:methylamine dehydrogenase accessory protein MauD